MIIEIGRTEENQPITIDCDTELSFKNFVHKDLSSLDFNNKTIYGAQFYSETPDSVIFPDTLSGTVFVKCNLDNVVVPQGATVIDCSRRRFKAQDDGSDWLIDENGQPLERL